MRKAKLLLYLQVTFFITFWVSPFVLIFKGKFPALVIAVIGWSGLMIIRKIRKYFLKKAITEIQKMYAHQYDFIKGGRIPANGYTEKELYCFQCEIEMPVKEKNGKLYCKNCGLIHRNDY